jgi:hypothetical protein
VHSYAKQAKNNLKKDALRALIQGLIAN